MFTIIRNKILTTTCKTVINSTKIKPKIIRKYKTLNLNQENVPRKFCSSHEAISISTIRNKSSKSKKQKQSDSSDEEEEPEEPSHEEKLLDRGSKVMNLNVTSMRLDSILKSGLGVSRNKIEVYFYESKVRLNGEKILKKSVSVYPGDEIDLIKGISPSNPKFLVVSRVEVIDAKGEDESITVKVRRTKSLTIENYKDIWKGTTVA